MSKQFENKVVVITGAGSGIGRAAAVAFAQAGARVAVADITEAEGLATVEEIKAAGGDARFFRTNVTQSAEVENLVRQVVATWGRLDVAINNAGVGIAMASITETAEADFDRVIAVNLKGVWLCMKHEISQMLQQGGGVIINMASALGITVLPGSSAYCSSKHAVAGLTRTAAVEYGKDNIRINALCPGLVRTPLIEQQPNLAELEKSLIPLHPIGRLGKVEEVTDSLLWLASGKASFVHGALISVDGGWVAQ